MNETKSPLASKTVWGAIMVIIAIAVQNFGFNFNTEDQKLVVEAICQLFASMGSIYCIYGRIKADKKIK